MKRLSKQMQLSKKLALVALLFSTVLLVACQKTTSSSSTKGSSSTATSKKNTSTESQSSSKSQAADGISVEKIKTGDYSSVAGTWKNGEGKTITFDAKGMTSPQNASVSTDYSTITNGILKANMTEGSSSELIFFAPSGTTFPAGEDGKADASDTSKDRIWIGQQTVYSNSKTFYYKVDDEETNTGTTATTESHKSQTVDEAIHRQNTGVWLSGGDSSIEYANKILGQKERTVIGGNYGMTNEIPYNTVSSSDEQVYVYQNGVIISQDNQILYEP